jgi:selenocysteine lyase/cysteine desulfurase
MPFTAADCERCRRDFPALERTFRGVPLAFLDGPAGTQVPNAVIDAVAGYYHTANANTHGEFPTSRETDRLLDETRETAAAFLGTSDWRSVSFGQNMTTLTYSLGYALAREMEPGDEIVITQLEHEANRGPWLNLQERGIVVREARTSASSTAGRACWRGCRPTGCARRRRKRRGASRPGP